MNVEPRPGAVQNAADAIEALVYANDDEAAGAALRAEPLAALTDEQLRGLDDFLEWFDGYEGVPEWAKGAWGVLHAELLRREEAA